MRLRGRTACGLLAAAVVGCQTPRPVAPDSWHRPEAGDVTTGQRPVPQEKPPDLPPPGEVVPAAFAQPAEPLPEPRPAPADPKLGDTPPAPPKALPAISGAPASVGAALGLTEVLVSVERNYPLLRAAEQERAVAGGRLVSAMGAFDFNLSAGADGQGPATYENFRGNLGVSQGIPVAGLGAFAGYRNGYGDFPTYNLGQKTATAARSGPA